MEITNSIIGLDAILLLGDPRLRQVCEPVVPAEIAALQPWFDRMNQLILLFRKTYGRGRAIAAPQVGLLKRVVCLYIDEPQVLINPTFTQRSEEMFELWDDCMSFQNLLVRLKRHHSVQLHFLDQYGQSQTWNLEGDLSELLQHELDHLDGILALDYARNADDLKWVV